MVYIFQKNTDIPQQLRDKVETFYRMYWHKQKAVSVTELLPVFPPTLPCAIYTDIYFEAQQKVSKHFVILNLSTSWQG